MHYEVSIDEIDARPTAVVGATTTWREYPALWPRLSNEVWACLRAGGRPFPAHAENEAVLVGGVYDDATSPTVLDNLTNNYDVLAGFSEGGDVLRSLQPLAAVIV